MNVQEVFTFLVSGGDSVKEELLDTWRRHLDQYANIHSQQVADHVKCSHTFSGTPFTTCVTQILRIYLYRMGSW